MANLVKRDRTHAPIKAALLAAGRPVKDCAAYAGLGFDILTEHVDGHPMLLEVKSTPKATLTESESDMAARFSCYRVVVTIEDALRAVGLIREAALREDNP